MSDTDRHSCPTCGEYSYPNEREPCDVCGEPACHECARTRVHGAAGTSGTFVAVRHERCPEPDDPIRCNGCGRGPAPGVEVSPGDACDRLMPSTSVLVEECFGSYFQPTRS